MIKVGIPNFSTNPQYSLTNEFKTLLALKDQEKINTFIQEHPTLVNQKLSNGLSPIEFAISQKSTSTIQTLLANNAQINQPNSYNITPLDYMINMKDDHLIRGVFGKLFSEIISYTCESLNKDILTDQRDEVRDFFTKHFSALKNEVHSYQSNTSLLNEKNQFISLINNNELKTLKETLSTCDLNINPHDVFQAVIYAAINHKNDAIDLFHQALGDEILKLRTVDFKDLYHIAAIGDNSELICKLGQWGLIPSNPIDLPGESYSPYFYALMHPTLNTFFALLKAKVPTSSGIDLSSIKREMTQCSKLNPFQFLALRANFHGIPLRTTLDNLHITYFSIDLLLNALALVDFEEESIGNSFKYYLSVAKNLVFAVNSYNLSLSLLNDASSSRFRTFLKISSFITCLGITNFIYSSEILIHHQWVPLTYCMISNVLLIKKVWNDFKKYKVNYQMQPWQTIKVVMQDMLLNAFHIKNIAFDWSALLNANSTAPTSTLPDLSAIVKPSLEKINECLTKYEIPENKTEIKNKFNDLFRCLFLDDSKNLAYISTDYDQKKRIFKQLSTITHVDKCKNALVPIKVIKSAESKTIYEFCHKLCLKYFPWLDKLPKH